MLCAAHREHGVFAAIKKVRDCFCFSNRGKPFLLNRWEMITPNTHGEVANAYAASQKWLNNISFRLRRPSNSACCARLADRARIVQTHYMCSWEHNDAHVAKDIVHLNLMRLHQNSIHFASIMGSVRAFKVVHAVLPGLYEKRLHTWVQLLDFGADLAQRLLARMYNRGSGRWMTSLHVILPRQQ